MSNKQQQKTVQQEGAQNNGATDTTSAAGTGNGAGADGANGTATATTTTPATESTSTAGEQSNAGAASTPAATAVDKQQPDPAPAKAPEAPAAPVKAVTPAPASTPAKSNERNDFDHVYTENAEGKPVLFYETEGLSRNAASWLSRLNEYIVAMRPGLPMDATEGAPWQRILYRTLMNLINNSDDAEFGKLFDIVLAQFVVHKDGVFHPSHSMRFAEHIELNELERTTFFNLLDLLSIAADAKGRSLRLRQVDLSKSLTSEFTERGRQRVRAALGK